MRISVVMNCEINSIKGEHKIESIHFVKDEDKSVDKKFSSTGVAEYFIKPDVVIAENGVGANKEKLSDIIEGSGTNVSRVGLDFQGEPACNKRFSLIYNDVQSPIYAAGSCTGYPSFMHKMRIRTQDVKFNIESGFYAAMNMLDKQVQFNYLPMTNLSFEDTKIYFVGERGQPFTEVITSGDPKKGKFVQFYVYGDEIVGFCTFGYKNLHLYLWQAMKSLIMPTAA